MINSDKNTSTSHIRFHEILFIVFFLFLTIWYISIESAPYVIKRKTAEFQCKTKNNTLVVTRNDGKTLSQEEIDALFFNGNPQIVYKNNEKYGYIDKTGKVIRNTWDCFFEFSEGMARIITDSKYGYINASGEVIVAPKWSTATDYENGVATVTSGNTTCILDLQGKEISRIDKPSPSTSSSSNSKSTSNSRSTSLCKNCGKKPVFSIGLCKTCSEGYIEWYNRTGGK